MQTVTHTTHHVHHQDAQQDAPHNHTTPLCGHTIPHFNEEQQHALSLASLPSYEESQQYTKKTPLYRTMPFYDATLAPLTNQAQEPPSSLRKWSVKGAQLLWKGCVNTQKLITTKLAKLGKRVVPKEIKDFHQKNQTRLHNAKINCKQRARIVTEGFKIYIKNAAYCSGIGTISGVTIGTVAIALLAANPLLALPTCFFAGLALSGTGSLFGLGVGLVGPFIQNPFKEAGKNIKTYEIKKLREQNFELQQMLKTLSLDQPTQMQIMQEQESQHDLVASAPQKYALPS